MGEKAAEDGGAGKVGAGGVGKPGVFCFALAEEGEEGVV